MSAARSRHNRPAELLPGPLPPDRIDVTRGMELEAGEIIFTAPVQLHASQKHGDDCAKCVPYLGLAISEPLHIGDDYFNPGKRELVARVTPLGVAVLIAVIIDPDLDGRYRIAYLCPISLAKVESRYQKGLLKVCRN